MKLILAKLLVAASVAFCIVAMVAYVTFWAACKVFERRKRR